MKLSIIPFILVFVLSFSTSIFSQQGSKVNPENMAGIIMYDSDEVIKKIKLKNEPKKIIVKKSFSYYNNKINETKIFNYITFNNVKEFIIKKNNEIQLTKDYRSMGDARLKIQSMLEPIRTKIKIQDSILNTILKEELTAKQYKNWTKYKRLQLRTLQPKAPPRPQTPYRSQSQRNGYGRGINQRRY